MATSELNEIRLPKKIQDQVVKKRKKEQKREQPIEIILELVEEKEVDPWDLDIIEVADKFLKKIEIMEKKDLEVTAKTLYCASILLRKKSDSLINEDEEEERERENEWEPAIYTPKTQEPPTLEPPARRESKRTATIVELMDELEKALKQEEKKDKKRRLKSKKEKEDKEKVKNLAHEERIEEEIERTQEKLKKNFEKTKKMEFSDLIKIKTRSKIIDKFISILFLANRDKIKLRQKEPYGEIYIFNKSL